MQGVVNDQRNQLFRELVGPVVVRAIGGQYRHPVGMEIGTNQMIRTGLGGGIGGVRLVGRGFGELAGRPEATVDLIGGNMQKAEAGLFGLGQAAPVFAGRFQ